MDVLYSRKRVNLMTKNTTARIKKQKRADFVKSLALWRFFDIINTWNGRISDFRIQLFIPLSLLF